MIIDCISDLHGHYPKLEGGDVLIVAGDLTAFDQEIEYFQFYKWLAKQSYGKIVIVPGNHDNFLEENGDPIKNPGHLSYLCDSGTEFEWEEWDREGPRDDVFINTIPTVKKRVKIWGCPWTLKFPGMNPKCMAFTCDTEEELAEKWALIPDDVDILVTHGPPYGIRDGEGPWQHLGSTSLLERIIGLENLKFHVFGHIHEGYSVSDRGPLKLKKGSEHCRFINCSHVNERYEPVNKPIRVIL